MKTRAFTRPTYIGDPINAIKIFNEKEVDELILLDIGASRDGKRPDLRLISEIATECFMPLCYGGGISTVEEIRHILSAGVEKVALNSSAHDRPDLISEAAACFGAQSVVASMDVKSDFWGRPRVYTANGTRNTGLDPIEYAVRMERLGAGELLLNSIAREGSGLGYDLGLVSEVSAAVRIPVIASGGAGKVADFAQAVAAGASAVAAGSMFVFYGRLKAVLINFPAQDELQRLFTVGRTVGQP